MSHKRGGVNFSKGVMLLASDDDIPSHSFEHISLLVFMYVYIFKLYNIIYVWVAHMWTWSLMIGSLFT